MRFKSGASYEKSRRVDLGLAVLECLVDRGQTLTYREIGEACGVSHQAIEQIEIKARKNFLAKFREAFDGEIPAEVDIRRAFQ